VKFAGVFIGLLGCVVIGFGVKATAAHASHASVVQILFGIFILTFGAFFTTVGFLAPKYGREVGRIRRIYVFDDDSPMSFFIPLGIVLICLEGTALYLFARFWH
jgi:hypothetical protein